ncbi:MAG: hypothetical protein WA004_09775 [Saprospiraceae bacterium]
MPLKQSGSKVFLLLSSLSKAELEDLRQYLKMPLSGAGEPLQALLDYCIPLHPSFPEEKVEKEAVHRGLFGKQAYKEKRIRDLYSDLSLKVAEYMAFRRMANEEGLRELLMIREFRARGLDDFAKKEGDRSIERMPGREGLGARGLIYSAQIREMLYELEASPEESMRSALDDLDHFFMISKLRLSALLSSRKGYLSVKEGVEDAFMEIIRRRCAEGEDHETEQMYLSVMNLQAEGFQKDAFQAVRHVFFEKFPQLGIEDRRIIYQALLNLVLKEVTERDLSLLRGSFDLYKAGLEKGIAFSDNGELSDTAFTNIIISGARLKEFEWVDAFIGEYQRYLSPSIRDNAVSLGRAFWYYNQGSFDRVLELLRDVKYSSVAYALRGRSLLLRTYFDQARADNWRFSEAFFYHLDATKQYVRRNEKLSPNRQSAYHHFLNFTLSLAQIITQRKPVKVLDNLMQELNQTQQVIGKEWLQERAEEIRGALK